MYIDKNFENPFLTIDEENNLLLPLNLFIDFQQSHIDIIPAIRESVETVAGVDGEIVYDTTYSPRLFDLMCYTPDNLTSDKKIQYKQHIIYTLNQLKTVGMPLLYQGYIYMVRLTGTMQPQIYSSWFNSPIQLKASDPYGYSQQVYKLDKNGIIRYNSNMPVGVIIEIKGEAINPSVTINNKTITYNKTIQAGYILTIDTENQQAFLTSPNGTITKLLDDVVGIEKKIQLKTATAAIINNQVEFSPYKNTIDMSVPGNTIIKWREKNL